MTEELTIDEAYELYKQLKVSYFVRIKTSKEQESKSSFELGCSTQRRIKAQLLRSFLFLFLVHLNYNDNEEEEEEEDDKWEEENFNFNALFQKG